MHKMSATMHKDLPSNPRNHTITNTKKENTGAATIKENPSPKITVLDIEKENRLSKVISLYSKGLSQEEIAQELHVDQSTVSRDLHFIKHEARKHIERYLREDVLFEYLRYTAGSNEITRQLWEIAQDKNATTKEKTNALSILMQSYDTRLQTLTTAPVSYIC